MIGLKGTNFCSAAARAISLLLSVRSSLGLFPCVMHSDCHSVSQSILLVYPFSAVMCFIQCKIHYDADTQSQNSLRLLAVSIVGDFLLFLGKVAVAAGCGLTAFAMSELDYYTNPKKYPDTYLSRWEG